MLATPETHVPSLIGTMLVLEDEVLVSMMIEDFLLDLGVAEVLVCGSAEEARSAIRNRLVHCAILDVRVGNVDSFELADQLSARRVPFFFATASGPEAIVERHRHRPILAKPFSDADLLRFVQAAMEESHSPA